MKIFETPIKVNYIFGTHNDKRKYMYDDLLKDGWRWNKEGEINYLTSNCKLIKEFTIVYHKDKPHDHSDVNKYFEKHFPRLKQGCSCDECKDDYELESWSEILHGKPLN